MAKLETSTVKKPKGKKRKHTNTETEDEVANKSVIVEASNEVDEAMQINTETEQAVSTKKSKKRKNKEKGEDVQEKRSKSEQNEANHEPANDDHEVDDELHEPTLEELKESEKPENNLAIVTGRQKKKQKHQKLLEAQKGQSAEKEKQRNTEYLNKWKHARDSWKFEKLRQISIQQTMFESDKLDDTVWGIALEYLAGSKGAAKDKIVKLANDIIEEIDRQCEQQETEEQRQSILNSAKYQRARDLLQIFD
ncbi:uncharacterized protein C7orf50 homolog isoform X1 [Lucilia cuprina]|uniref:uncharacterized protein C7orf50 homolog isoform X1 n=1 Tax=Lucilia cuprina TaxID=7375 RepID=UPI001F058B7E|nr:uncharacterized protein C7orf50 homolog isoform X1 [Lucilia cuprina]